MRVKVTSVLFWAFLLAASSDARPQELGSTQVIREDVTKEVTHDDSTTATTSVRSRLISPNADLQGYRPMNQSLKSVTTQLLNVSESSSNSDERLESRLGLLIQKPQTSQEISDQEKTMEVGTSMNFGRFSNSKFNYFENSHPGHAMALTEEELEKELAADRHPVADKTKPTTTPGGISTWVLVLSPSTTSKSTEDDGSKVTWKPAISGHTTVKIDTTLKADLKPIGQRNPQSSTPKSIGNTQPSSTTVKAEKTVTRVDSRTTPVTGTTEALAVRSDDSSDEATTVKSTTKKIISSSWTLKPTTITTPNATTVVSKTTTIKVVRPSRPSKPAIIRKPSTKVETLKPVLNSTSKIEKVTFRPVQMIAIPKPPAQPPMFVAKIQASVQTDTPRNISASQTLKNSNVEPNTSGHSLKLKPHKPNIGLKAPQKSPDHVTTIQIDPIKVNAPILTIEKIADTKTGDGLDPDKSIELDESKIDMKFDFDPELTKIIETSSETSASTGTTKKPKNKRKKNKIRRRKPSSTTVAVASSTPGTDSASEESTTEAETLDISLQESKIVSDAQVLTNSTKNKKKQGQKPISTQIYNFISREVMSNFGMMSLVGLGLGIASYFFYPFGTPVARRNGYEDPKVKYNMDFENGGNGGQNEEEIMSQVLQGMTMGDKKYGGMKDYENNYYRYQAYDGAYTDAYTTRRGDVRYPTSAVPVYRPEKTRLPYDSKYRHTDFKYPDAPTTSNYYDRQAKPEFLNNPGVDRQFVVGNVPKEYSYDDQRLSGLSSTTENIQTDFEKQIAQSMFVKDPIVPQSFSPVEEQSLKANEGYEDIEITPTAVAVEHGPRALQLENIGDKLSKSRKKRDSNIQLIPTRKELEKSEAEEDLSNEILDIIDSAIPTKLPDVMSDVLKYAKAPGQVEEKISTEENKKKTRETVSAVKEVLGTVVEITKKTEETETQNSTVDGSTVTPSTSTIGVSSSTVSPDDSTTTSDDGLKVIAITSGPTTATPTRQNFNFFDFVKKLAEVKFRVGLTLLKHASESFTKYLGNVQKRLNDGN